MFKQHGITFDGIRTSSTKIDCNNYIKHDMFSFRFGCVGRMCLVKAVTMQNTKIAGTKNAGLIDMSGFP